MDKQRELFEMWAKAESMNTTKYGATGVYCYPDAHRAWAAWQAAIESIVVYLPMARSDVDYGYEPSEIIDLLESAGIKHK